MVACELPTQPSYPVWEHCLGVAPYSFHRNTKKNEQSFKNRSFKQRIFRHSTFSFLVIFWKEAHRFWSVLLTVITVHLSHLPPLKRVTIGLCSRGLRPNKGSRKCSVLNTNIQMENSRKNTFIIESKSMESNENLDISHARTWGSKFNLLWVKCWGQIWGNSQSDWCTFMFCQI